MDRKVLAAFLTLHYAYRHYKEDTLNSLLFSEDTQKELQKTLGLSESQFNKSLEHLKEKELIKDNKINPIFTKYPRDANFKLQINFILED